ncbi:hypothetical protein DXB92_08955 [Ruminococcus sp. OM06-36AC]|nr:hypothetical protein DXB92_08955 [Ruminococcus sp. OM06-36AC]
MPAEFLCNLPKNLTTHLTHKLYSVFPKAIKFAAWHMMRKGITYYEYCLLGPGRCTGTGNLDRVRRRKRYPRTETHHQR